MQLPMNINKVIVYISIKAGNAAKGVIKKAACFRQQRRKYSYSFLKSTPRTSNPNAMAKRTMFAMPEIMGI